MFENYQEMISFVKQLTNKPKLLLHSCCAPCSTHVLFLLKDFFDITVYYSNDNIFPLEEFKKRATEEKKFCEQFQIPVLEDEYDSNAFEHAIQGYELAGERSERCYNCYQLRLTKTAKKASMLKFDYFTTTLSISPYKVSRWINEIGLRLEQEYKVPFLYSDFKKENGYQKSIAYSKQYGLYRQDYCGCKYSKEERAKHIDEQNKEN